MTTEPVLVNAGAITAAGLVVERHGPEAADRLLANLSNYAGRTLVVDEQVVAKGRKLSLAEVKELLTK